MKITMYTISDCYFSKQEKDYLGSHNLQFEEKNLEENRDFLTEMLTISNNFAGTPVTKIEKDDGSIVVLKGFTKDEFDQTFGFSDDASKPSVPAVEPVAPQVVSEAPVAEPVVAQETPIAEPVVSAPVTQPVAPVTHDMDSIAAQIEQLKKLQASLAAQQTSPVAQPVAPVSQPVVAGPVVQPVAPVVSVPTPEPVAPPVAPTPVAPAPVSQPTQAGMDDSLAAILAELQAKINSQPGTPPPAQNAPTTS